MEPALVKFLPFLKGIMPLPVAYTVLEQLGVLTSMDHFMGRPKSEAIPEKKRTVSKK
jgi:hypothetical protein